MFFLAMPAFITSFYVIKVIVNFMFFGEKKLHPSSPFGILVFF